MCEPALADFIEGSPCVPETRFALPFGALFFAVVLRIFYRRLAFVRRADYAYYP